MMKSKNKVQILVLLSTLVFFGYIYGQENDNPFTRTQALLKDGVVFFNVDGIEITAQKKDADFSAKNCINEFSHLKIKKKQLTTDSLLGFKNYYVFKSVKKLQNFFQNTAYYFVETPDNYLIAFTFSSINKNDKAFERNFITLACNNRIPKNIYHSVEIDSVNFAGRKISLRNNNCRWMGVNNVQCRYCGQMNWSIHKDLDDAMTQVNNHFVLVSSRAKGRIISDTIVNVIFEGAETKARKIVFDHRGSTSLLLRIEGSNRLIVYFIAVPVRGNFVSCVMSFWESDQINPGRLPPLLEQVMKLK